MAKNKPTLNAKLARLDSLPPPLKAVALSAMKSAKNLRTLKNQSASLKRIGLSKGLRDAGLPPMPQDRFQNLKRGKGAATKGLGGLGPVSSTSEPTPDPEQWEPPPSES